MKRLIYILILAMLASCGTTEVKPDATSASQPEIFPDYTDVTVPPNLAAPRFWLAEGLGDEVQAVFTSGAERLVKDGDGRCLSLSDSEWERLRSASDSVKVTVTARKDGRWTEYAPFHIIVAAEPIDPYIAYRLIEPGYESWNEMGIYQRCLENYDEQAVITNRQTNYGCMNCHNFCDKDPDKMLLHLRKDFGGTYFIDHGNVTKLDPAAQGWPSLVYPGWHPSGDMVAFSTNDTRQLFHTTDPNRIEVLDLKSDVVVYDIKGNRLLTSPLLQSEGSLETFPCFSPDGRRLYFCSAVARDLPEQYDSLRYNVCAIDFDPSAGTFGNRVDTVYNAAALGKSTSFPRVSPDGRHLMFTRSGYGTFSIWHRDADLYMTDLSSGESRPLDALNSDEAESYHTWSSNGRWVVFSSRRMDGLYTRPYIAYIDADGNARKPLVVPPEREDYYDVLMKSYNVPEFVKGPVKVDLGEYLKPDE